MPTTKDDFFPEENSTTNGLAQFIPQGDKGAIIVTTRDFRLADQLADSNTICKDMMEVAQAVQLFTRHYPNHHELEQTLQLLGELQHLPLAIVQVAAYLRQNTACSLTDYIGLFDSTRHSLTRLLSTFQRSPEGSGHRNRLDDIVNHVPTDPGTVTTFGITLQTNSLHRPPEHPA